MPESASHSRRRIRTISTSHGDLVFGGRCFIMGILNVTPDSFSDGGCYMDVDAAIGRVVELQSQGADVLDIGGESTRPGSTGVSIEEQIGRVVPVIRGVRKAGVTLPISIDTQSVEVATAAMDAGADLVNDVSAGRRDPSMPRFLAKSGLPFIAMHMKGTPQTMQVNPHYDDVVAEVEAFFQDRAREFSDAGVDVDNRMLIDPGIGFGKSLEHNLTLIRYGCRRLGEFRPVVVGPSRKRFIGELLGEERPSSPQAASSSLRLMGTAAVVAWCATSGVDMVRVHDVSEMRAVVDVCQGLRTGDDMET